MEESLENKPHIYIYIYIYTKIPSINTINQAGL